MRKASNQLTRWKSRLERSTVTELAVITSPITTILVLGVVFFSFPLILLGWLSCGLLGLLVIMASGRTSNISYSLVNWPRPETIGDVAINGTAYNSVLVLGISLAQVVWIASDKILLGVGIGAILPCWFLKHIHLLVFLGEEWRSLTILVTERYAPPNRMRCTHVDERQTGQTVREPEVAPSTT